MAVYINSKLISKLLIVLNAVILVIIVKRVFIKVKYKLIIV